MNDKRIIIHVDLNSFFATAEQQTNPALRGKPIGVIKAKGRSCIIASSVEAKKLGVMTGARTYDAKKLCPEIILVPANFSKYADISRRFIKICASYSPACEVFSLDECFLDVTETEHLFGNVFNIAFEIKDRIKCEIGDYLTCSVGISHNKLLSKLASGRIKYDGLFWITEDNALKVLDEVKLMDVCGLGWGLYEHLTKLGIDTFAGLRALSLSELQRNFEPFWGIHLYNLARGIDTSPVAPFQELSEQKSVGRTYTTHRPLKDRVEIYRLARNLCEEATAKARVMGLAGRYVDFYLRTSGKKWSGPKEVNSEIQSWHGHRTLKNYIDSGKELFDICKLISENWDFKDVIFCGVTLGMLAKKEYLPLPIFEADRKLWNLIISSDQINNRFGDYTVFPAQLLGMPIIMPEVTGYFGDKAYRLRYEL
ncbi:hypothetical protein A3J17_02210 [Candidatus Curtissbacteria bacterium RIFCSPLOWO2_02_FULL_40_11]|uniref:DNA-directed DNA polymerase n=2 Tax=Candidatus Curtissiibacteriota TaxID=1752717 RepID=A0A1F5G822_9BACT|nr:MAG: hypothetical protein A3D04_02955 [Candidatus Curtissbacteria bacterium RIFCSPHIGHO2_02_FULL_40_16b]OGD90193.1 MAG: hypothetical protein A3E11_00550 [Candidatus Curtissbacteria bacterium RIFCSPHIGHO2_12_FULL_38_37]OGE00787.1 MAG: hypothetical protein A3J17_02210 [Candidatus Curtissbacteria bacterium RIFCSPLOWO2_02_FULL_40_11]OGE14273.1 MAG: hypothetical protein A3G14_04510 [Candidatus Curtissbacteria bacterium RIFCSPLOWO2_12_FULL_38_9]